MDQRQPGGQLRRTIADVLGEAVGHRLRRINPGPEPAIGIAFRRPERRFGVAAQHGGQRALIPLFRAQLIQSGGQPGPARGAFFPCLPVAGKRAIFAIDPRQFGACGGHSAGGFIPAFLQGLFTGLLVGEGFALFRQCLACLRRCIPCCFDRCIRIAIVRQGSAGGFLTAGLAVQSVDP